MEVPGDVGWDRKGSSKPNLHVCGEDDTKRAVYNMDERIKKRDQNLVLTIIIAGMVRIGITI